MKSFDLLPAADIDDVGIRVLVEADGTPKITALSARHTGVSSSIRNITTLQARKYWAHNRRQKIRSKAVRTFTFCGITETFRIDFQFERDRLKKFRVKKAIRDISKFNVANVPNPGIVPISIKSGWYEAQ